MTKRSVKHHGRTGRLRPAFCRTNGGKPIEPRALPDSAIGVQVEQSPIAALELAQKARLAFLQ